MTDYILNLTYDIRQITQSLVFEFCQHDGSISRPVEAGALAGSFNFQAGDTIKPQVTVLSAAHADKNNSLANILDELTINECMMLSIGARMVDALSMFDEARASQTVAKWDEQVDVTTPEDMGKNIKRLQQAAQEPFKVVSKNGQWKVSGYLSVTMVNMAAESLSRLYYFDPEGSTGPDF